MDYCAILGACCSDTEMNVPMVTEIRVVIEASPIKVEICDLHVWRVGKGKFACILSTYDRKGSRAQLLQADTEYS